MADIYFARCPLRRRKEGSYILGCPVMEQEVSSLMLALFLAIVKEQRWIFPFLVTFSHLCLDCLLSKTSVWLWLGVPNTLTVPLGEYLMDVLSREWIPKPYSQSQKNTHAPLNHSPPLSRRCRSLQQGKIPMQYNICWPVLEFLKNPRDFRVQKNGVTLGERLYFCFEMYAHIF